MELKRATMWPSLCAVLMLAGAALARPWHSSEELGSWGSYSGIGGRFGGGLSANFGGNLGLGYFHNQQNGGSKGSGINIFGTGSSSLASSGYGNFGIYSGGHRYPKGYGFLLFGRPGRGANQPSGNDGRGQPDPQTPDQELGSGIAPNPKPNSQPESVSTPKPSIDVPYEVDTSGVADNIPQPDMSGLPGTSQTDTEPEFPPERVPFIPVIPRDSLSIESLEYPQSRENSIEFLSREMNDFSGEVTSDEILLGGAGVLNPRVGLSSSSEETTKKLTFIEKLRRLFG